MITIRETQGEVKSEDEGTIEKEEDNYKQENIEYEDEGELLIIC